MDLPARSIARVTIERPLGAPAPKDESAGAASWAGPLSTFSWSLLSGTLAVAAIGEGSTALAAGGTLSVLAAVGAMTAAMSLGGAVVVGSVALLAFGIPEVRARLDDIDSLVGWSTSPLGQAAFLGTAIGGGTSKQALDNAQLGAAVQAAFEGGYTVGRGIKSLPDAASALQSGKDVSDYVSDHLDRRGALKDSMDDSFGSGKDEGGDTGSDSYDGEYGDIPVMREVMKWDDVLSGQGSGTSDSDNDGWEGWEADDSSTSDAGAPGGDATDDGGRTGDDWGDWGDWDDGGE